MKNFKNKLAKFIGSYESCFKVLYKKAKDSEHVRQPSMDSHCSVERYDSCADYHW